VATQQRLGLPAGQHRVGGGGRLADVDVDRSDLTGVLAASEWSSVRNWRSAGGHAGVGTIACAHVGDRYRTGASAAVPGPTLQTIRMRSSPKPSTAPTSSSPLTTAATPSGVPEKIRSPGCSSKYCDKCAIISSTLQISLETSLCWRTWPFTVSEIFPFVIRPVS